MNRNVLKLDPTGDQVSRHTGSWVLLASLLINFFLLGLLVAPWARPHHPPFPPFGPPGNFIEQMTNGLSPADAEVLRKIYAKDEPLITAARADMDSGMHRVTLELQKPTVDQAELQKALDTLSDAHDKMHKAMDDLVKSASTGLSPDGRRIFSENGLHPHGPPPDMGSGPPPDMPPPDRR